MIIEREFNNRQYKIKLTANEIRQAHEEFIHPAYMESAESLNLGRHFYFCFRRYDIKTITDLVGVINSGKICGFRGVGPVSIRTICRALDDRNIPYDKKYIQNQR